MLHVVTWSVATTAPQFVLSPNSTLPHLLLIKLSLLQGKIRRPFLKTLFYFFSKDKPNFETDGTDFASTLAFSLLSRTDLKIGYQHAHTVHRGMVTTLIISFPQFYCRRRLSEINNNAIILLVILLRMLGWQWHASINTGYPVILLSCYPAFTASLFWCCTSYQCWRLHCVATSYSNSSWQALDLTLKLKIFVSYPVRTWDITQYLIGGKYFLFAYTTIVLI